MSEKHHGPPGSREHAAVRLAGIHPAGKQECLALGVTHENLAELCSLVGLLRGAGEWPPPVSGELATANQFGFAAANNAAIRQATVRPDAFAASGISGGRNAAAGGASGNRRPQQRLGPIKGCRRMHRRIRCRRALRGQVCRADGHALADRRRTRAVAVGTAAMRIAGRTAGRRRAAIVDRRCGRQFAVVIASGFRLCRCRRWQWIGVCRRVVSGRRRDIDARIWRAVDVVGHRSVRPCASGQQEAACHHDGQGEAGAHHVPRLLPEAAIFKCQWSRIRLNANDFTKPAGRDCRAGCCIGATDAAAVR